VPFLGKITGNMTKQWRPKK